MQRAEVILARRTESGFCCKNCFGCALQEARAFATLNQNTLRPAATQGARADAPLRPRPTELSFTAVFTAAGADAELRLRVLQSCGCVGDAARLRRTCRAFRTTYASAEFPGGAPWPTAMGRKTSFAKCARIRRKLMQNDWRSQRLRGS